jgi:hypothetical protein
MGTVTNNLIQKVTIHIILDQVVGYCSPYFGSGCWLLFRLLWIRLLVTVPFILNHAVGYCSGYFGSGCLLLFPSVTNSLIQNIGNSNQQPDPK